MNPFEPLYALLDEPIMTHNTTCRNILVTKRQCFLLARCRVVLNPTAKGLLEVILIEHFVSPLPHASGSSEFFAQYLELFAQWKIRR
jgi:hypothetical protein